RGPVEATRVQRAAGRYRHFRARAGAAPLKRLRSVVTLLGAINFRARAGAAPLKLTEPTDRERIERHFRARAGAAPLKHRMAVGCSRESPELPRPRGRGPVEAGVASCANTSK